MNKKKILITGCTDGIGKALTKYFLKKNFFVLGISRNKNKISSLKNELLSNKNFILKQCDVSNQVSVIKLKKSLARYYPINAIINCAGIHGSKGYTNDIKFEKWKEATEINLFGTFLINKYFIDKLKPNSVILNFSGGGATKAMPFSSAYSASKAAVVRYTETIAKEMEELKVKVSINAIAPGAINTKMLDEYISVGNKVIGKKNFDNAILQKKNGGQSIDKAIELCYSMVVNKSYGLTGKLISAQWDDWENFKRIKNIHELNNQDDFTLRRIKNF